MPLDLREAGRGTTPAATSCVVVVRARLELVALSGGGAAGLWATFKVQSDVALDRRPRK